MATGDASKSDDGRPVEADNMEKANFLEKEGDAAPLEKDKEKEKAEPQESSSAWLLVFCFVGLQASFLTWGYVQERVMTTDYATGRFPSSTFCVFSNRVLAIVVAAAAIVHQHRTLRVPAPMWAFAPCSLSNTLSSYGQYQALRYVSFPLQTLSKSTKVIPVMLMGKLLNRKSYRWVEYGEAGMISLGVSMFAFSEGKPKGGTSTEVLGILMLALYVGADSFTSQWQSRVYRKHPAVDQFQMMCAALPARLASTHARFTHHAAPRCLPRSARRADQVRREHVVDLDHARGATRLLRVLLDAALPRRQPCRHLGPGGHLDHLGHRPALHLLHNPQVRAGRLHHHHDHTPNVLDGALDGRLRPRARPVLVHCRVGRLWHDLLPN